MKKLYLVDISSIFFRAFYAIPPMHNKSGTPTNALYGFLSMVVKLLKDSRSEYMVFCQDRKEPSFRKDLYSEYKANRTEMPEELALQMPYIERLIEVLGVPAISLEKYEADDVIGSLVHWGKAHSFEVVIVSGDKDFAQLIEPGVVMLDTMKNITYDEKGVIEKWGVSPHAFTDYLALVGDSSDNIPGVRGVGPKSAQKLLNEFQSLDGVYENLDKISGKALKEKVSSSKELAYLSKELVTIVTHLDLVKDKSELQLKPINKEKLLELLRELEFKSFESKLLNSNSNAKVPEVENQQVIATKVNSVGGQKLEEVSWSVEEIKTRLAPYSELWLVSTDRGIYLYYENYAIRLDPTPELSRVLSQKQIKWMGYNLKQTWRDLELKEVEAHWDSLLAAYVLKAGAIGDFEEVYKEYLEESVPELAGASEYYECHQKLKKKLQSELKKSQLNQIYKELELPLCAVLLAMENNGIYIDQKELSRQSEDLRQDIEALEKSIYKLAGEKFNIASPKQLAPILFDKLGLPALKKTKTGYSTNSDVLQKLAPQHPICGEILEYRELAKLKSTYVDALPKLVNPSTKRIHTYFNQAVTATGRLSSTHPNLQNIPIRTERGRLIRKAFQATDGNVLLSADYSQIELRVLAHVTDDPGLCRAFDENQDIHTATASEIYGISPQKVTPDLRRMAKAVNFGIAYGQGAFGLAETLGISRSESKEIIDRYFEKFKNVKDYIEETIKKANEEGYVETIMGRRRYIKELKSKNPMLKKFGERAAINAPIQGSASDIVKKAMIQLYEELEAPMLLQVHDEIVFECDPSELDEVRGEVKSIMEAAYPLRVPLIVNIHAGQNWDEAH